MPDHGPADARREFIRAWYRWQRVPLPVESFRQNRLGSRTLRLEHDLDHLRSYVHSAGSSFMAGKGWSWPLIVSGHLEDLREAEVELDCLTLSAEEKRPYREFVAATRRLLTALAAAAEHGVAADKEPE